MKSLIMTFILLIGSSNLFSQSDADDVLGVWVTDNSKANIEIYKENNEYFGKIIWSFIKDEVDDKNPDPALQNRTIVGLELLKHFVFDGDNEWEDGEIYDPKSGKTYSCKMWLDDINILNVKGYIGISLLGRSTVWTRKE